MNCFQIEIAGSFAELDCYSETSEADYDVFAEAVNNSRRAAAERTAPPPGRVPGPPGMANGEHTFLYYSYRVGNQTTTYHVREF